MDTPRTVESIGRAFLAALVARLGHEGAAAVLLLAEELSTAARTDPAGRDAPRTN